MSNSRSIHCTETIERFSRVVGKNNTITGDSELLPYLTEWRGLFHGKSPCVLRPSNAEKVSQILRIANEARIPIVPQGGNTGLVGGQIPDESGSMVIISLERLNKIRQIDTEGNIMTVEAGVTLETIHQKAKEKNRMFPLTLGSQGSCRIGGNISTNAGGTAVLAYGNTRELILGLEVVLADGKIWNGLRTLRKDNTGYDLKQLFIGSEGTLGIVTAANIKLFPVANSQEVAFVGIESPEMALELFNLALQRSGSMLTGFELIPRIGIDFCLNHLPNTRDPLDSKHSWYALVEISSGGESDSTRKLMENTLASAMERNFVENAVLADSIEQQNSFWKLRHGLSEVQKHEGGSIKHDISVPVSKIPEFLNKTTAAVTTLIPDCRPVPFGHMGDGNIHYNVSQPINSDKEEFLQKWDEVNSVVHEIVVDYGGSISAEHGIGRLKKNLLRDYKSSVELAMMQKIKSAFDPNGIMNPGCIF